MLDSIQQLFAIAEKDTCAMYTAVIVKVINTTLISEFVSALRETTTT